MLCLFSYFCGSVPFGKIVGNLKIADLKTADVQKLGSGNIGATNVFRTLGWEKGLITFLLDFGKGALPVYLGIYILPRFLTIKLDPQLTGGLALFFALIGSIFPVWLKFKGGKGVSVFIGGLLILIGWKMWLIMIACWFIVFFFIAKRIVSLANLILVGVFMITGIFWLPLNLCWFAILAPSLIFLSHLENIKRLIEGKEPPLNIP